ncbi:MULTISPECIES: hypothetical protein [Desulfococcus]|uniref:YtkA-like domain-containing protein n=1 Tax=Desulfococcus multivorans DSM 2059 TaxID=1121405 RepID=S7VEV4_DESML|nr:hypothetical protein [Desulfococcus multivorans]AOY59308.1 conserved uncharacterized protein [Desulfococcus multivorans]AQV03033.2 hypothetical protein B2D07_12695 [Desulfococcus multivorans]EPR42998.1 hypothetical protein dsmv_1428 [Desulfococcus multivorans DSM 2059]SKA14640.1 hypothetical protein SAMN02745446_02971 [Desulfococcus multivorans DSM 2059]
MMHHVRIISACLATAGIFVYLATLRPDQAPRTSSGVMQNCDIQRGPCTQPLGSGSATLEILPRPVRAMRDLTFRITLAVDPADGSTLSAPPYIDLDMPDMFMGYNRVHLTPERPGIWSGTGVIVRCPSGIPTWKAVLTVPDTGETVFVFDVRY